MNKLVPILIMPLLVLYACAPVMTQRGDGAGETREETVVPSAAAEPPPPSPSWSVKRAEEGFEPIPLPAATGGEGLEFDPDGRREALEHFYNGVVNTESDLEEAIKNFSLALLIDPGFTEAHYNLGVAFLRTGNLENAKEELFASLKSGRQIPEAYEALGTLFVRQGKLDDAERAYGYAIALGAVRDAMTNLANVYRMKGLGEASLNQYKAVEHSYPMAPYLNYNLGTLLVERGDASGALESFGRSLELKDTHPEILLSLANAYLMNGEVARAIEILSEMTATGPERVEPYRNMGIIYELYLLDYEEALKSYRRYVELEGAKADEVLGWIEIVNAKARGGGQ
jgi:tetratricopeptide (TPR) repeat protein